RRALAASSSGRLDRASPRRQLAGFRCLTAIPPRGRARRISRLDSWGDRGAHRRIDLAKTKTAAVSRACGGLSKLTRLTPHDGAGAADEPRELLETAADAVGNEIDKLVLEH